MAISGIINSTSARAVTNFLNSAFGDKLSATVSQSNVISITVDGHEIFRFGTLGNAEMYDFVFNSSGQIINNNFMYSGSQISVVACSNGFIAEIQNTNYHALYFLTFNNDGTIIYGGTPKIATSSFKYTSFVTTTWNTVSISTTATSLQANSTTLVNLLYQGNFGQNSIAEKGYFALYNQYPSSLGIATLNNKNYIVAGCFYIAD